MKKIRQLLPFLLLVLCFCLVGKSDAYAASTASYSTTTKDKSKTYGSLKAKVYYKRVVLKGSSDAVKKINKSIKADMDSFLSSSTADNLYDYAESAGSYGMKGTYRYSATSSVTYNANGIISIRVKTYWYAGGVSNTDVYGLTYDLNTGEKLNLVKVCSGNSTTVKNKVLAKIRKDSESSSFYWSVLNSYSAKKMDYYINSKGNAVVCFGPYEIATGGWYRTFTIKSKYS